MKDFVDIKDMPNFNSSVKNGIDSVSTGKVKWIMTINMLVYPSCLQHGAMNKVSEDGIWRCLTCGVGCYELNDYQLDESS